MREFVIPLLLLGCGHIGYDATNSDPPLDTAPFGEPELVTDLSIPGSSQTDPSLTGDLREIYMESDNDIYWSRRDDPGGPWPAPIRNEELSSNSSDFTPEVSADGLRIHFASNRAGSHRVYSSFRNSRGDPWQLPQPVEILSTRADEFTSWAPAMSANQLFLVLYRSSVPGAEEQDLFEARRSAPDAPWSEPRPMEGLSTPENREADGSYTDDALTLIYSWTSSPTSSLQSRKRDLALARREGHDSPWVIMDGLLDELNTELNDEDPWISPDGRTIYFVRDEADGQKIFRATR